MKQTECPHCKTRLHEASQDLAVPIIVDLRWLPATERKRIRKELLSRWRGLIPERGRLVSELNSFFSRSWMRVQVRYSERTGNIVVVPEKGHDYTGERMRREIAQRFPHRRISLAYGNDWDLRSGVLHRVEDWGIVLDSSQRGRRSSFKSYRWNKLRVVTSAERETSSDFLAITVRETTISRCKNPRCASSGVAPTSDGDAP